MRRGSRYHRLEVLRGSGQDGFALIEAIVAFVILTLGIGTIVVGVATAMRSDASAHNGRVMNRIAHARLESAGVTGKLVIGRREGGIGQFTWTETVRPATTGEKRQSKPASEADGGAALVWIEIVVRASDGSEEKLAVLKLASQVLQ